MIQVRVYRNGTRKEHPDDLRAAADTIAAGDGFVWLDAQDPTEAEISSVSEVLQLHPLTLEDVRHRHQRPKVELFEHYAFLVVRPMRLPDGQLEESEVFAFASANSLVTLRFGAEGFDGDQLEHRWLRQPELFKAHAGGAAAYFLLDEVVDGYLSVIEELEDRADALEDLVVGDTVQGDNRTAQQQIFRLKREIVRLRRVVSPLRQGLDLLQEESAFAGDTLQPYLRDVTEHVIRVSELADNVRDLLTSLIELQVAKEANQLNDTVRTLTAWAAIVVVPTLIASIYGMNFDVMPELHWHLGYGFALAVMVGSAVALWASFKRRGWL
jgi:magnesium transporter